MKTKESALGETLELIWNDLKGSPIPLTGGKQIIYHYDCFGKLIGESTTAGDFVAQYIYLGNTRLAAIDVAADLYYYINDHLGTPQKMIDKGTIGCPHYHTLSPACR